MKLKKSALSIYPIAISGSEPDLVEAYNSLCDVLDSLNKKLAKEREGPLPKVWKKIEFFELDSSCRAI